MYAHRGFRVILDLLVSNDRHLLVPDHAGADQRHNERSEELHSVAVNSSECVPMDRVPHKPKINTPTVIASTNLNGNDYNDSGNAKGGVTGAVMHPPR